MEIEVTSASYTVTPGEQLKKAREASSLSEEQVAEHLKITVGYIQALESDDYDKLPDTPYIMGYLRAYTRLVNLDTEVLLEEFQRQFSGSQEDEEGKNARKGKDLLDKMSIKHWLVLLIIVILVWAGAVFMLQNNAPPQESAAGEAAVGMSEPGSSQSAVVETDSQAETEAASESDAAGNAGTNEAVISGSEEAPADSLEQSDGEQSSQVQESQVEQSEQNYQAQSQEAEVGESLESAMDTLAFVFSGECWLEITDANGDVLAADLYQDGDAFKTQGKAPFSVMLGNVRVVELSLNGEHYQLEPDGFRKTLRTVVQ